MTKKDYELIARVLKASIDTWRAVNPHATPASAVRFVVLDMADELAVDNPRFDYERFLAACGLVKGEDFE